jgi:hypothetical protein
MRVAIRSASVFLSAIVAAVLVALTATTSALADTALMIGGIAAGTLPDLVMKPVLNGKFDGTAPDGTSWNRVNVVWPAQAGRGTGPNDLTLGQSITVGTNNLDAAIAAAVATGQSVTVVGMSAGALVADEELRRLASRTDAPDASQLTFVMIADSSRQSFINESQYNKDLDYTYQPAPDTKYNIIVVTGEYDGAADFPDRPWNLLAVVNAIVGAVVVHVPVMFKDLPAEHITTTNSVGGETTHYLVPTERLPLVQLFPSLAPIEGLLKQWVDAGYSRNDQPAVTTSTALSLTTGTGIESSTLANDAPVGALTEPVEAPAQAGQGLAEATTEESVQADQRVVDTAEEHATASDVKAAPGEPAQAGEGLVDAAKESASATGGLVEAAAKEPAPDTATEAVSGGVPDLTDGKKESPSTKAGITRSSSRSKPGDEIRAATGVIQRWFSRTNASTSKIEAPASDTSTPTGSEASSSTSSSPDSGSTP